jgi:3-oxoacyl-[acyl-carrier-protein] synthase III
MRRCRIESLGVSPPGRRFPRWGSVRHSVEAARRCLKASRHPKSAVGLLINAGVYRDQHICEPAMAVFVQHRLGLNIEFQGRSTMSFDLQNGGCGMLDAAQVASTLLQSGEVEAALVVAGEVNPDRRPDPDLALPASGAALLMDLSPWRDQGFGEFAFHTRDEAADMFTSYVSLKEKRGRLFVERRAGLEEAYLSLAGETVEDVLARDGRRRDDIDLVVSAQISPGFMARLPAAIGCPDSKVLDFSDRLPDTHSTSLFLALSLALADRRPQPGQTALLLAFGSGVTAAAATYRF